MACQRATPRSMAWRVLPALVLAIYLVVGWATPGYAGDMETRKAWAHWLLQNGLTRAYENPRIDYPPASLYLFEAVALAHRAMEAGSRGQDRPGEDQAFTFLIKLPYLLFQVGATLAIVLVARVAGPRRAWLAAAAYGLNPAVAYDVAHLGQSDTGMGTFGVLGVGALVGGRPAPAGALLALAALSKPQTWVLLPLACLMLGRWHGRIGLGRAGLAGLVVVLLLLMPWLLTGRLDDLARLAENLRSPRGQSMNVISANAHNLWWLPTLARGRWIDVAEPLLGSLTYEQVALSLTAAWLGFCLLAARRLRQRADLYLVAAAASFGFFMLMVRAHENHGYLVLPFLAVAAATDRRRWPLYVLGTTGLLLNLALRDALLVGSWADMPASVHPAPVLVPALQVVNVGLNLLLLGLFARQLWAIVKHGQTGRKTSLAAWARIAAGVVAPAVASPGRWRLGRDVATRCQVPGPLQAEPRAESSALACRAERNSSRVHEIQPKCSCCPRF